MKDHFNTKQVLPTLAPDEMPNMHCVNVNKISKKVEMIYNKGDVLSCHVNYSIVQCVVKDLKMGRGAVFQIKNKFGGQDNLINTRKTYRRSSTIGVGRKKSV
jgi:hypothetical protein